MADKYAAARTTTNRLPDVCNVHDERYPILRSSSFRTHTESTSEPDLGPWHPNIIDDDEHYAEVIRQAELAIEGGVLPVRIAAGSSGSYFVRNLEGVGCETIESDA